MEIHGKPALHALHLSTNQLIGIFLFSFLTILCVRPATCLRNLGNATDRLALLQFKSQITSDSHKVLSSWNVSVHFCSWQGVTCSLRHSRVKSLNLGHSSLFGTISPYVGNLSFLSFIDLRENQLSGEIPREVDRLFRLRYLNLTENKLTGEIPINISHCSNLRVLEVRRNKLVGTIPAELGSLKKLVTLGIGKNNLTGEVPPSLGNLSSLQVISVAFNNLKGNIPHELGKLASLKTLKFGANNFTGTIPFELYNISSITNFFTASNALHGSLPANIGLTLPNLVEFGVGGNRLSGTIPATLTNASFLELLDISENSFVGQVPNNLGVLKALYYLSFSTNFLGSNTSEDFSFMISLSNCSNLRVLWVSENNFGGVLPKSIANLSIQLEQLVMGNNQICGKIPAELGNLVNLYSLGLEKNRFSGTIPTAIGKIQKLQVLRLEENLFLGEIPANLGNLSWLYELYLQGNQLEGNITSSIMKCQNLHSLDVSANKLTGTIPPQVIGLSSLSKILNFSQNSLTGSLPSEIGNLKNINALDISQNQISGDIPDTIGGCSSLEILNLQSNSLQGPIPSSIVSLRGLQFLDLSKNNLSRNIPKDLEEFKFLVYLNLSFNNLEGEVPAKGVFSNISAFSVAGNTNLCGGIPELHLPKCIIQTRKHDSHAIILAATIVCSIFVVMALTFLCVFYHRKSPKNSIVSPSAEENLLRVSYEELFAATKGFSSDSLIGQGSFGLVYKGRLQKYEKGLVAVKVLNLQQEKTSKSFIAECKALRNSRHRNLVKIVTYCSITDFRGNEFKALVFDYMENGSLEMWLHPEEIESTQSRSLNLLQRLCIAIDVASALDYLHENCEIPIIHCDLKPSNILLDEDMTAHVGDFGLARLISKSTNTSSPSLTSSMGIKGSVGYIPPEYGLGSAATKNGDVYSYGIILLEMFTGKRPTDGSLTEKSFNLHNFVKAALPEGVMQVVNPALLTATNQPLAKATTSTQEKDDEFVIIDKMANNVQLYILSMLKLGLECSADFPKDRMNIRDVLRELNHIKDAFLRTSGAGGWKQG